MTTVTEPVREMSNSPQQELDFSCLQGDEPLDEELLEQLCASEDIWNGIQFPELPDELLGQFANDLNTNSINQFDEFPGLSTPPESPPETVGTTSAPLYTQLTTQQTLPITATSPPTSPQTTPITPSSFTTAMQNCNLTTPACPQRVKNNDMVTARGANGQLVQVLKSGEVVPISALLASVKSSNPLEEAMGKVKQEVIGQKRPHPSSPNKTTSTDVKLSKRQQRLIKNRESASLSRQKKKEYVTSLEDKLREAAMKNLTLLRENENLREQISKLERENQSLRFGYSQPGSPLSSAPRPAMVFVLVLCFTLALFPLRSYISSPAPITSLSVPLNPSGRALMSLDNQNGNKPPLDNSNGGLLTPQKIQRMLELKTRPLPLGSTPTETVCTCPVLTDKHNVTRALALNSELSFSFNREERLLMNMLQEFEDKSNTENSLMIVNGMELGTQRGGYDGECYCRNGVFKFYKSLKKSMTRDLSNYYLVSFKDHLLLNAPLRNNSNNPILSVIVPAHNGTYHAPSGSMPMLQLDCQVFDSKILHIDIPQ